MGRLIIRYNNGLIESFKCKSKENALKIVNKRSGIYKQEFSENNEKIKVPEVKSYKKSMSFEGLSNPLKDLFTPMDSQVNEFKLLNSTLNPPTRISRNGKGKKYFHSVQFEINCKVRI